MGSLPTHSKSTKLIPMIPLTVTLCVTLAVILGSIRVRTYDALMNDSGTFFNFLMVQER